MYCLRRCYPQTTRRTRVPGRINTAEFLVVQTTLFTTTLNKNRRNTVGRATSCESVFPSWFRFPQTCVFRQAISTGLVNRCAMCKGRPRRTGERVCGRTCRERERQAVPVQGSYYGARVVRLEPRTGPGV